MLLKLNERKVYAYSSRKRLSELRFDGENTVCDCVKSIIKGSDLIKNTLLRLYLSHLDSDNLLECKVIRVLTLRSMRSFLTKFKKAVPFSETQGLRVRTH